MTIYLSHFDAIQQCLPFIIPNQTCFPNRSETWPQTWFISFWKRQQNRLIILRKKKILPLNPKNPNLNRCSCFFFYPLRIANPPLLIKLALHLFKKLPLNLIQPVIWWFSRCKQMEWWWWKVRHQEKMVGIILERQALFEKSNNNSCPVFLLSPLFTARFCRRTPSAVNLLTC